jgi:hypothetical protein
MSAYAVAIGASDEVLWWCQNVLTAQQRKRGHDVQATVEHIIDYLASDAAPKRLRKMSYKQAKDSAEKWSKAQQKKGAGLIDGPEDIETIHDFLDGTRIVKLKTQKAYQREGFFMAHCVGGYQPEKSTIYSYRDAKNIPHATFEVSKSGDEIVQIKGKGNGPIHPRYIHPILAFLKTIGMEVRPSDMINLGYQHLDDEAERICRMFVDPKGKGPEILTLFNEKYLAVGDV